ncbi:hypothetical protein NP945_23955 [Mesorhizobium sp. LMG17149]|nr:hypothetical protein [Mesorhizobium sp. LMG17149]MCQ8874901.1 hypothetical protein [Mesorhizobium sp. LMG17149]
MRLTKNLLALIALAIGALWSLQGIGIVTMVVGLAGLVWANR